MNACYPLRTHIANWEFYNWLVLAAAKGATKVFFDIDNPKTVKWNLDTTLRRFHTIIEPGPALIGLPSQMGSEASALGSANMNELVAWSRSGKNFPRLKSVLQPNAAEFTVTIRKVTTSVERNSCETAWRQFAQEIGAVVIEDYDVVPMHLHERFALYAGAKMNFGVTNGPIHALTLSEYPVMMFVCNQAGINQMKKGGISHGEQYPWMRGDQHIIWSPDTVDSLRKTFTEWESGNLRRDGSR
jgi:hypothetical protein